MRNYSSENFIFKRDQESLEEDEDDEEENEDFYGPVQVRKPLRMNNDLDNFYTEHTSYAYDTSDY